METYTDTTDKTNSEAVVEQGTAYTDPATDDDYVDPEDIKPGPNAHLATAVGTYNMQMDDKTRLALWDLYINEMTLPTMNGPTDNEWAEKNGISPRTLRRWKGLKKFKDRQRDWVNETHFSSKAMAKVWANMFKVASTEQGPHAVAAAKMIADASAKWEPPQPKADEGPTGFESMSVAELHEAAMALGMESETADVS